MNIINQHMVKTCLGIVVLIFSENTDARSLNQLISPQQTLQLLQGQGGSSALSSNTVTLYELEAIHEEIVTLGSTQSILVVDPLYGTPLDQEFNLTLWINSNSSVDCQVQCLPTEYNIEQFTPISMNSPLFQYFAGSGFALQDYSFFITAESTTILPGYHIIGFTEVKNIHFVQDNSNPPLVNPIAFVTQVPIEGSFKGSTTLVSNHHPGDHTFWPIRGGDLMIAYPSGNIKNITAAAGYGQGNGPQWPNGIVVRDPHVHFDGDKIIFSMIVGDNSQYYNGGSGPNYHWQLYEATNLGEFETPVITKVAGQPENYSNTTPMYLPNDEIVFASDYVEAGKEHLFPYLDEYEREITNAGMFKLTSSGKIIQLDDSPSGVIGGIVDSFGRILYIRWDHLNRDEDGPSLGETARVYPTEEPGLSFTNDAIAGYTPGLEWFPEAPNNSFWDSNDPIWGGDHRLNTFIIWQINGDGTEVETLNHSGRHEFMSFFPVTSNFPALAPQNLGVNAPNVEHPIELFASVSEDPNQSGRYLAVAGPEFETHGSGEIIEVIAPKGASPTDMVIKALTHPSTANYSYGNCPNGHTGFYRNPIRMINGSYVSSHSTDCKPDSVGNFNFRLKLLSQSGQYLTAASNLTPGFTKTVSYYQEGYGQQTLDNVELWELQPVEVVARSRPKHLRSKLPTIEKSIIGNKEFQLRQWMKDNNLALIVSRNITSRDDSDRQQAYNLKVKNSSTQTNASDFSGTPTEVEFLQLIQGDRTKGYGYLNGQSQLVPSQGRRIFPEPLRDPAAVASNIDFTGLNDGRIKIAPDGSVAAFVPASKAMTWQLTKGDELDTYGRDTPVVRERYWITFQAGEIRVCASCHGLNDVDQAGNGIPQNPPQALQELMDHWAENLIP